MVCFISGARTDDAPADYAALTVSGSDNSHELKGVESCVAKKDFSLMSVSRIYHFP
jgi:hypothetical protein